MATTKKEFVEWLDQFPDEAIIRCLTSSPIGGWGSGEHVHEVDFKIEPLSPQPLFYQMAETFEIMGKWGPSDDASIITEIVIGTKQ